MVLQGRGPGRHWLMVASGKGGCGCSATCAVRGTRRKGNAQRPVVIFKSFWQRLVHVLYQPRSVSWIRHLQQSRSLTSTRADHPDHFHLPIDREDLSHVVFVEMSRKTFDVEPVLRILR